MDQTKEDEECQSKKNRVQDNGNMTPNTTIPEEILKNLGLNPNQDRQVQDTKSYSKTPYEARHIHEYAQTHKDYNTSIDSITDSFHTKKPSNAFNHLVTSSRDIVSLNQLSGQSVLSSDSHRAWCLPLPPTWAISVQYLAGSPRGPPLSSEVTLTVLMSISSP